MANDLIIDFDHSEKYRISSSKPLVTILINNYNYDRYLAEALDSALAQTWQPLEIIVVDDGSTDNSRDILGTYRDKIRIIFKENGGQASAFNAGIKEAKGEIICFLDSDDYWYPNKVEKVVAKYQQAPWGLVCHDLYEVDAKRNRLNDFLQSETNNTPLCSGDLLQVLKKTWKWMFSATSGMSLPSKLAREIIPLSENDWRISADAPLAYASICHAPVGAIQEALGEYRIHGKNGYASIKVDSIKLRLQHLIDQAKVYIFLKNYLQRIECIVEIKNPKEEYKYYRQTCLIAKDNPIINLFDLWKVNINTTLEDSIKNPFLILKSFKYIILDTIVVLLIYIKFPSPYKLIRAQLKELEIETQINEYLLR